MATINYPLTKTVLSAEGSAEVIAYGTNTYTALWSDNTDTDWSLWDTFPTVVRFGNYVYCWHKTDSSHTYYILIDVVEDPNSGNALGGNLAYPELTNPKLDTISNVYTGNSISAALTDGPYTPLAIGDKEVKGNTPAAGFETTAQSIDFISPVFTNGTLTTAHISGNSASAADIHRIRGWGDHSIMAGTNGANRYGLFAPFATKEQFEFIYGKESDWVITPHSTQEQWLFDNSSNTSYTVAYANGAGLTYPFTVAAMIPNTLYRDVAGDTTGDGNDNTPSLEDALALYAITTAFVPALDPTKCEGFPGDLSIPGIPAIDINSIKEKLNDTKAGIEAAISSTGLLDLEKTLDGLRARILAKIPKPSQVLSLAADMAGIDPSDFDAIEALNEKWKGVVDDVSGFFDDLGGFDICSLIGLNGKVGADGVLEKKAEDPSVPESEITSSADHSYVSKSSRGLPQSDFMAEAGMTTALVEKAQQKYNSLWQKLADDEAYVWAKFFKNSNQYEKEFKAYQEQNDYVKGREATARKEPVTGVLSSGRITQMRKEIEPLLIPHSNSFIMNEFLVFARQQLWRHMLIGTDQRAPNDYFPTTDFNPSDMWNASKNPWPAVGNVPNKEKNFLGAQNMTKENRILVEKFWPQMVEAIKKYLFSEEGVQTQLQLISYWAEHYQHEDIKQRILDELVPPGPVHPTVEDAEAEALKSLVSPVDGVPMDDVSMTELGAGDTMLPAAGVMPPPPPKK